MYVNEKDIIEVQCFMNTSGYSALTNEAICALYIILIHRKYSHSKIFIFDCVTFLIVF
jgi:membrane-bound metal-dependent hydrolase YbcI (DUF457 family)